MHFEAEEGIHFHCLGRRVFAVARTISEHPTNPQKSKVFENPKIEAFATPQIPSVFQKPMQTICLAVGERNLSEHLVVIRYTCGFHVKSTTPASLKQIPRLTVLAVVTPPIAPRCGA